VVDVIYDVFVGDLAKTGGVLITDGTKITSTLWAKGHLNSRAVARDATELVDAVGLTEEVPSET